MKQNNDVDELIYNNTKKFSFKRGLRRWVYIYDILTNTKLCIATCTNKETKELLIRLELTVEDFQKKTNSNIMPLRAFKIILKPFKKGVKLL